MALTTIPVELVTLDDGVTISVTDNSDVLTLKSTDADENSGPRLALTRDSGSPADNDYIGLISFNADDDGGNVTRFGYMVGQIADASNTSEDGILQIHSIVGGTERNRINITSTETVFNEDSVDLDFRVESDGDANMLVVDGGNNRVGVGTSPDYRMHIFTSDSGASAHANSDDLFIENSGNAGITIGSGTTSNGSIFFSDSDSSLSGQIEYRHNGDSLYFYTGAGSRLRIDSDGIKFGSDTAAANALDDYEEGTWTPVIQGTTQNGSFSSTTVYGKYTKVGNLVTANFYVGGTHNGNYTGQVLINGFPYAVGDSGQPSPNCYTASYNVDNNGESLFGSGNPGTTYFLMYMTGTGTAWGALNWGTSTTGASGTTIYFTGTYQYRV